MAQDLIRKRKIELLAIGGSAGSLEVLLSVFPLLRTNLSFGILIVLHRKYSNDSSLTDLIASKTSLMVKEADDKDGIFPGWIYVAPADYHLLVENDKSLSLDFSEKVNFSWPGIDVTFQTASEAYGPNLACLLLSGASSDGADGLMLVRQNGGITAVQDPAFAEVSYMPQKAIDRCEPDYILNNKSIASFINSLNDDSD